MIQKSYTDLLDELSKERYCVTSIIDFLNAGRKKDKVNVILRHDVDYAPDQALKLAEEEQKRGLGGTFFILMNTDLYDVRESDIPERLSQLGFEIGLHVDQFSIPNIQHHESLSKLKSDLRELEHLSKAKIYGMVAHGAPGLDNISNLKNYAANHPADFGLKYHDGTFSLKDCKHTESDNLKAFMHKAKVMVRKLKKAYLGDVCYLRIHPICSMDEEEIRLLLPYHRDLKISFFDRCILKFIAYRPIYVALRDSVKNVFGIRSIRRRLF